MLKCSFEEECEKHNEVGEERNPKNFVCRTIIKCRTCVPDATVDHYGTCCGLIKEYPCCKFGMALCKKVRKFCVEEVE